MISSRNGLPSRSDTAFRSPMYAMYASGHAALAQSIDDMKSRIDRIEGLSAGLQRGWTYTAAAMGLGLTLIGILIVVFK